MDTTEYESLTPEIISAMGPGELQGFFGSLQEAQFYGLSEELIQAITPKQIIETWKETGFILPFLNSATEKSPFLKMTVEQIHYYNITIGNNAKVFDAQDEEDSFQRVIWKQKTNFRKSMLGHCGFFGSYIESEMPSVDDGIPGGSKVSVLPPEIPLEPPIIFDNPLYSDFFTWQNAIYPGIKGEAEPDTKLYSDFFTWQNAIHPGIKPDEPAAPTEVLYSDEFTWQDPSTGNYGIGEYYVAFPPEGGGGD
jgi:hypothetical protein